MSYSSIQDCIWYNHLMNLLLQYLDSNPKDKQLALKYLEDNSILEDIFRKDKLQRSKVMANSD